MKSDYRLAALFSVLACLAACKRENKTSVSSPPQPSAPAPLMPRASPAGGVDYSTWTLDALILESNRQMDKGLGFDSAAYQALTESVMKIAKKGGDDAPFATFIVGARETIVLKHQGARNSSRVFSSTSAFQAVVSSYSSAAFPIDDGLLDAQKGKPMAPVCYLRLGQITRWRAEEITPGGLTVDYVRMIQPAFDQAEDYFEKGIASVEDPNQTVDQEYSVLGNLQISLLDLFRHHAVKHPDKARAVALRIIKDYPNVKFVGAGWGSGETHPEALSYLADNSPPEEARGYLWDLITKHPKAWSGKPGSDDGGLYVWTRTPQYFATGKSPEEQLALAETLFNAPNVDALPKAMAALHAGRMLKSLGRIPEARKKFELVNSKYSGASDSDADTSPSTQAAEELRQLEGTGQ